MNTLPRKLAAAFALLVLLYALFGYVAVPRILESRIPALAAEHLGREAAVGDVAFDPFAFHLEIRDLDLRDRRGGDFVRFALLSVDFEPLASLFGLGLHFDEIALDEPKVDLELLADGELDVADLAASDDAEEEPAPEADGADEEGLLPVRVGRLAIRGGEVDYTDRSRAPPFERSLAPIEIEVTDFDTRPGLESAYAFSATTAGGARISWSGRVGVDPLRSSGEIEISNVPLHSFWEFVGDRARFVVTDGQLDVGAGYDVETVDGEIATAIRDGSIVVSQLAITPRGDDAPFVSVSYLGVDGIAVDVDEQRVDVASLASRGARLSGGLDSEGAFTWLAWLALDPEPTSDAPPVADAPPAAAPEPATAPRSDAQPAAPPEWTFSLAKLSLEDWGFAFEDRTTEPPVAVSLEPIALDVENVSLDLAQPLPVHLATGVGEGGSVRIDGSVTPDPLHLELELAVEDVDVAPFGPYLSDVGRFRLARARVGATGSLRVEAAEPTTVVRYAGSLEVRDLAAADAATRRDFLRLGALALRDVDLVTQPLSVTVGAVDLARPYARVWIDANGETSLARIFGGDAAAAPAEPAPASDGAPIRVDRVTIADGVFEFADESVDPTYETSVAIGGSIGGLSSDPRARAKVDLSGKVNGHAPVVVAGEVNPLAAEGFTDLDVRLSGVELSSFTPYSGKYAGYSLSKGKFTMDLEYKVDARDVEGDNRFFLDQLEFGDRVDSAEATSLPVPLAVAILKDAQGEIHIDLPVRGNLDDPEFSYGGVLRRTFVNLITRAATSPFAMIGGLAGWNADELDYVAFAPGAATLDAQERQKLGAIAEALGARPALRLEIRGVAAEDDVPGLKAAAVERALKQREWDDLSASARASLSGPDDVVPSPDDRDDRLEELYEERVGESYRAVRNRLRDAREAAGEPAPTDEAALVHEEMLRELVAREPVGERELRALARSRAAAVRDELVVANGIAHDRVFLVDVALTDEDDGEPVHSDLALAGS